MKRETLYKITVIVLLVLNLLQISFPILSKKPPQNLKKPCKPNAVEMLYLNPDQDIQFREFGKKHNEVMDSLQKKQKQCVRNYFLQPTDSLLNNMKEIEAKKILVTKKHFEDMRSILKEEQLTHYEEFKNKALKFILR